MIDMHAQGTGKAAAHLEEIARRALNPEPAFREITGQLCVAEKRLFASSRLKPLKPATVKRKARSTDGRVRANADRPLVATGKLEAFLTSRGAGGQPVRLSRDEMIFGIPGGRHDLHYVRYQAAHGRNPLVSRAVVRRIARPVLAEFVTGSEV